MQVNGDFPHRLAEAADRTSSYVIHLSTDAVFSGRKGRYCEADRPDPIDFYGHTKLHGELDAAHCVTLRTTFYGIFHTRAGLLQSFLSSSPNQWHGYANYVFSAVSAKRLADVIGQLVYRDDRLHGIYHVAGEPISKLEFLQLVRDFLGMHGQIMPVMEPVIDRSLDSSRFWDAIDRYLPSQRQMIEEMRVELKRARKSLALRPAMRRMIT
jgi:dTDP-4-dehydrorhamnose reductase